ncbi:MAG: hypothetical protein WCL04_01335 [Verrucomicrobiota bacterium]
MKKSSPLLPLLCGMLLLLLAGCGTASSKVMPPPAGVNPMYAQFFLEQRGGDVTTAVPLPMSGIRVPVDMSSPVMNKDLGDISGVEITRTEHEGLAMVFHLSGGTFGAISAFSHLTASHQGYRLVLTIGGRPIAVTTITAPISNGVIAFYPELDEKTVFAVADGINYVSGEIQRQLAKR